MGASKEIILFDFLACTEVVAFTVEFAGVLVSAITIGFLMFKMK